jgi:hypothetical protein
MTTLLLRLYVFARFFKYLSAFGRKTFARDEGFGGFDYNISLNDSKEINYLGMSIPKILFCKFSNELGTRIMLPVEICGCPR